MLVFENDSEIEEFKKSYDYNVSMQEIFNTWQQNNCANNDCLNACNWGSHEFGNIININTKDKDWSYSGGFINMTVNKSLYSMFISNEIYQANTYVELMISAIDKGDDDVCGIIFGYKQVGSNEMHTLSYITGPNHNQNVNTSKGWQFSSLLAYDFCQPTYKLLIIQKHDDRFNNPSNKPITKFKIVKTDNKVTISRSRFYATESEVLSASYDYTATYTLPNSKPSDMDQTTYNNIKEMLGNSKIGFATFSWNCKFKIISSNTGLMQESLYNLNNDTIQTLQNGTWVTQSQKVSEVVPYRVFLYNDYNDTLFFYYYKQTYCKIATSGGGVTEVINELVASGSEGQVLKIHNNGITPDNNFRVLRVVDNDTDFNTEISIGSVSMSEVFNNWGRYNSFNLDQCNKYLSGPDTKNPRNDGQNNPKNGDRDTMWKFSNNMIKNGKNLNTCDIFVSNEQYTDYELEVLCQRLDEDDDYFGIVLGYQYISDTKFNYVILLRCDSYQNPGGGQSNTKRYWIIAYNWMCPDCKIIVDHTEMLHYSGGPATKYGKYCKLYVKKDSSTKTFTCKTSNNSSSSGIALSEATKFTWTMPATKPSDWTDDMWNNMNKMIGTYSYIGTGVQSQPCAFSISTKLFSDINRIYRLDTDEIFEYNSSSSSFEKTQDRVSEIIPLHSWLYNKTIKKLFNYSGKQSYTLIDH